MAALQPTLDIFGGSKTLGRFYREENEIVLKYADGNLAFQDTEGRYSFQWLGKTRIIIIQGAHDGTGFDGATANLRLADFIFEMEAWVNADVSGSQVYTDSFGNTYNVDPVNWTWSRSASDANRILYSLIMKEAGANL